MSFGERTAPAIVGVATAVVGAAYQVHLALGPGLLESVYVACLAHELHLRRFAVRRDVPAPVLY